MLRAVDTLPAVERVRGGLSGRDSMDLGAVDTSMIYGARCFHDFLAEAVGGEQLALVVREGGQAQAALCLFEKTVPGVGTVINSLPWYGSHGGCFGAGLDDSARRVLLAALREYVNETGPLSATVICTPEESAHVAAYRSALAPRAEDSRIGQFTRLPAAGPDFERELEAVLRQKTRNQARKARRQDFVEEVRDDADAWHALHELHVANMAALGGMAKPWSHLEALRRHIPAERRRLSLAMAGDEVAAALLVLAYGSTVEYLVPAIAVEHRSRQPLSFLIWHAMQWAAEQGYACWNWGGTWGVQDSLHHFKAGWGAVDRPYHYFIMASEAGVDRIRTHRGELRTLFPFYYVYPFTAL
ncbi:MAG: GNAT family N-acetyltransferase [Gammaproteobacteria bacterium]|nr:GNAT family N-acetyltransferase [Gammaproteobacteria bacterium]